VRSHIEMVIDVMGALSKGVETPTQLYYQANLSYRKLQRILDRLILAELVAAENKGKKKRYKLTRKGNLVLRQLEEAFSTVSPIIRSWDT